MVTISQLVCIYRIGSRGRTRAGSILLFTSPVQVETIEFALQYSAALARGYTATTGSDNFTVAIPKSKFVFGYPAQPQACSSGYIDPAAVTAMVRNPKPRSSIPPLTHTSPHAYS